MEPDRLRGIQALSRGMHHVSSADGTTIAYDRVGEGPPIICLHGTGVTRHIWDGVAGHLDDSQATLIIPDRRGRGESGDTLPWAFERELEDVAALVDAVDGTVSIFGSSYGGLLAVRAAERLSVEQLLLFEPPMPREVVSPDDEYESLAARVRERLDMGDREAAVRLFFEEATGASNIESWPIWPDCVELAETIARESAFVERFELGTPSVTVPTLLFRGRYSPEYLQRGVGVLAERLPDTTTVEINSSHAGVVTAPEEVANAVGQFLE